MLSFSKLFHIPGLRDRIGRYPGKYQDLAFFHNEGELTTKKLIDTYYNFAINSFFF